MISSFSSTTNVIGLHTVSTCCFEVFFYFLSFLLAFFSWNQCLEFRSMVVWEIKLIGRLAGFLISFFLFFFNPFLTKLLLCFVNHFFFHLFCLFIKFWDALVDINFFMLSCFGFNDFLQLKPFIFELFLHDCSAIFIFRQLFIILKQLFDCFSGSGFCFLDTSLIFFFDSSDHLIKIIFWEIFILINNIISFFFEILHQLITSLIDFDERQALKFGILFC